MGKKQLCSCGKPAEWCYDPGYSSGDSPFSCDDCVSRGCSCNNRHIGNKGEYLPDLSEDGVEGVNWKWIQPGIEWTYIDEQGREYPCCEYSWDENHFEDWDDE